MSEREAEFVAVSGKPSVSRAMRLVYIMRLLEARCRTIPELADLCGVTERTIYRDIADLQAEPLYVPILVNVIWQPNSDT